MKKPPRIKYLQIIFSQGYNTGRYKSFFGHVGKNLVLSKEMTLINIQYFKIGNECSFAKYVVLEAYKLGSISPIVRIRDGCNVGEFTHITCVNRIEIGCNFLTGRFVLITDNSHGNCTFDESKISPLNRPTTSKGPIVIGDNVWIGDKATILPNVTIGDGAIIAANSVVTKNIPAYSLAAGNPAIVIRQLH